MIMIDLTFLRQPKVKLCLHILLILAIGLGIQTIHREPVRAQSSEITSLRTQVNRLETQVRRLNQQVFRLSQTTSSSNRRIPPSRVEPVPVEPTDPMFDRLATLVIELKERVTILETRMEQLEQSLN